MKLADDAIGCVATQDRLLDRSIHIARATKFDTVEQ